MNRIALGTVQFGLHYGIANQRGKVSVDDAKAMLQLASNQGMDTLDTAISYGDSEKRLGEIGTNGFKVITKLPPVPIDCADVSSWVENQVAISMGHLGVTTVEGLLLHRSLELLGLHGPALYAGLQKLRDQGKVNKIGISIYAPSELDLLIPKFEFQLVQAPFNLIDQRLTQSGWMKRLSDHGVEIHTRSAFLQGLLLMDKVNIPPKFMPWHSLWDVWHNWLSFHGASALEACLGFCLAHPEIGKVVVGADNFEQLQQIIDAANKPIKIGRPNLQNDDERLINPANWTHL